MKKMILIVAVMIAMAGCINTDTLIKLIEHDVNYSRCQDGDAAACQWLDDNGYDRPAGR